MMYLNHFIVKKKNGFFSLFPALLLMGILSGCSSSVWNNPHGLLGGLFSSSSPSSPGGQSSSGGPVQKPVPPPLGSIPSSTTDTPSDLGRSLSPPEFVHVVPFAEGDGLYLQWSLVAGATDYFLYKDGRLVADTPSSIYRLYGLLPCHRYHLSLWSSDSVRLSKKPLAFNAHTRGCSSPPKE